jgi:ribosomal protein S18 acetylase RimI-like enzyme
MALRRLGPDDVAQFRAARLAALRSDPHAFSSDYRRELGFGQATWSSRLAGYDGRPGVVIVDERNGGTAGMVGIGLFHTPGDALLWGMWVDPHHRHAGIGRALVAEAAVCAAELGASAVILEVLESNTDARRLYERCGFVADDRTDAECGLALRLDLAPMEASGSAAG